MNVSAISTGYSPAHTQLPITFNQEKSAKALSNSPLDVKKDSIAKEASSIFCRTIKTVALIPYNIYLGSKHIVKTCRLCAKSLFERAISALPYYPNAIFQNKVKVPENALTNTEPQRLLGLKGDDGMFGCRIADGWHSFPTVAQNGRVKLATRDILRLNNITVFRGPPGSADLEKSMIGPNHYYGVLDDTHTYTCTLKNNEKGIPQFIQTEDEKEQLLPNRKPSMNDVLTVDADWKSGKLKENKPVIQQSLNLTPDSQRQSLTPDIGVVVMDNKEFSLPQVDGTQFDLSEFGAKLVRNDLPFRITKEQEDPLDVITYHFGSKYADMAVKERNGLFLETHNFTQIMSPMTKDSGGFITLGRKNEAGKLELIAVKVPYGYSIIVDKGAIHGDASFVGSYLMAMTVNHKTMGTADVYHLKDRDNNNVMLKLDSPDQKQPGNTKPDYLDKSLKPLVVLSEGETKPGFDKEISEALKPLNDAAYFGSPVIANPLNKAGRLMRHINQQPLRTP